MTSLNRVAKFFSNFDFSCFFLSKKKQALTKTKHSRKYHLEKKYESLNESNNTQETKTKTIVKANVKRIYREQAKKKNTGKYKRARQKESQKNEEQRDIIIMIKNNNDDADNVEKKLMIKRSQRAEATRIMININIRNKYVENKKIK